MRTTDLRRQLIQLLKWEPAKGGMGERVITIIYVMILSISILAVYMAANHVAQWIIFKADSLWMEEYLRDLIIGDIDMKTWNTPGAPNYFPEMLVYGLLRFLTGSVYWSYIGYGFLSALFYVIAIYKLLSFVTCLSSVRRVWFATLCVSMMLLAVILLGSQFNPIRIIDFWQTFTVAAHGGAITNSLIAVVLVMYWFRDYQGNYWWFAGLLSFSILASLSDRLYLVWFSMPTLGALCVLFFLRRVSFRSFVSMVCVLVLSDFIGRKLFVWLVPLQIFPYNFSFVEGWLATIKFYTALFDEGWYHPFVLFSYVCLLLVAIIAFYKMWLSLNPPPAACSPQENPKLFLLFFAVLCLPISFLAVMIMNRPHSQYFTGGVLMALSVWPFLFVMTSFGLQVWAKGWFHGIVMLVLVGYIIFIAASPPVPLKALIVPSTPYSSMVACLDKNINKLGGGNGVADFWQARKINLFSRRGIYVDQAMGGDLMVFQWASDREMFENKKHTFIITNTTTNLTPILEEDVVDYFGKPDNRLLCDGFPVLVYKNGVQVTMPFEIQLQNLLTGVVDEITLVHRRELLTDVGEWRGPTLYSTGNAGWLQIGPYVALPKGTYRVEWFGKLEYSKLDEIGFVDVSSDLGSKIIANQMINQNLLIALPEGQIAALQFTINRETPLVEFRFNINQDVLLYIDKVVVTLVR